MTKTLPSVAAAALLTLGITLGTTVSVTAGLAPTASAIDTTTIAPNLPYVTKDPVEPSAPAPSSPPHGF